MKKLIFLLIASLVLPTSVGADKLKQTCKDDISCFREILAKISCLHEGFSLIGKDRKEIRKDTLFFYVVSMYAANLEEKDFRDRDKIKMSHLEAAAALSTQMCRGTFEQNINKRQAELFREGKQITGEGKMDLDDMVDVFAFSNVVYFSTNRYLLISHPNPEVEKQYWNIPKSYKK